MLDYRKSVREVILQNLADTNRFTIGDTSNIHLSPSQSAGVPEDPLLTKVRASRSANETSVIEYYRMDVATHFAFLNAGKMKGTTGPDVHTVMDKLMYLGGILGDATLDFVNHPVTVDGSTISFTLEAAPGSWLFHGTLEVSMEMVMLSRLLPNGRTLVWN